MASTSTLVDRVKILVRSSGTGPFQLGSAVAAYRGTEALLDGQTYSYAVESGGQFEVGTGVYILATSTFVRSPSLSSSGGAPVSFPSNVELNFTLLSADLVATGAVSPTIGTIPGLSDALDRKASYLALGASGGETLIGTDGEGSVRDALRARMTRVTSRTTLKALNIGRYAVVFLEEGGRTGIFRLMNSDAPSDPLEGISIQSNTAGWHWKRNWDEINGQPEWFGAVTNSNAGSIPASNVQAIQACVARCPVICFAAADYFVNDTVSFNTSFRTYRGPGPAWDAQGKGTRIVSNKTTADVINVGPGATDMHIENICAVHAGALVPPPVGEESTAPKAWAVLSTISVTMRACSAIDPLVGFYFHENIYTKAYDCRLIRGASYGANDFLYGFWAHDDGSHPGLAGSNGSLHLFQCNVTGGGGLGARGIGLYANGDFADLFVAWLETSGTPCGIKLNGAGSSYPSGGHGDVRIVQPTIDQANSGGIEIVNLNSLAKVQISGGYVQMNDNGAENKALFFHNGGGYITVSDMQLTGNPGGVASTSIGCRIQSQPNVTLARSVIIENFAYPCDVLSGCTRFTIHAKLQAGESNSGGTRAALTIDASGQGDLAPEISGGPNAWVTGININGSGSSRLKIDPTLVDPGAINSARKLTINGATITAPGYYNPDGTSNPTAYSGVYVEGITA